MIPFYNSQVIIIAVARNVSLKSKGVGHEILKRMMFVINLK